jgi:hypothetical protein
MNSARSSRPFTYHHVRTVSRKFSTRAVRALARGLFHTCTDFCDRPHPVHILFLVCAPCCIAHIMHQRSVSGSVVKPAALAAAATPSNLTDECMYPTQCEVICVLAAAGLMQVGATQAGRLARAGPCGRAAAAAAASTQQCPLCRYQVATLHSASSATNSPRAAEQTSKAQTVAGAGVRIGTGSRAGVAALAAAMQEESMEQEGMVPAAAAGRVAQAAAGRLRRPMVQVCRQVMCSSYPMHSQSWKRNSLGTPDGATDVSIRKRRECSPTSCTKSTPCARLAVYAVHNRLEPSVWVCSACKLSSCTAGDPTCPGFVNDSDPEAVCHLSVYCSKVGSF